MAKVKIEQLMATSGVKFGTSGARGLVADMNDRVCFAYTLAFLNAMEDKGLIQQGMEVAVAGDFRPSSPRIMRAVGLAVQKAGFKAVSCGFVPTPALALYALSRGIPGVMVTGSHIPDDRNGIKFYKPAGEILKDDEQAMCSRDVVVDESLFDAGGQVLSPYIWDAETQDAHAEYVQRYLNFFPDDCLLGKHIGVYEHSSVARDMLCEVFAGLGADVVHLGRSDSFIPVDTEAVRSEDIRLAKQWSKDCQLDCIVSADGDGDRPLVSDEQGNWLRGDVAGILCARFLRAENVATPVSCNSAVEKSGEFKKVVRTRIGSPFVIEAMNMLLQGGDLSVVGYEANGGFLTATAIRQQGRILAALPTRDALIVPLAILMLSVVQEKKVSELLEGLPQRFTSSGRIQDFPTELSQKRLAPLQSGDTAADKGEANILFGEMLGEVQSIDVTDGVRITFASDEVVHLRPSGNAPELRCYSEADSQQRADAICESVLAQLASWKQG